MTSARRQIEEHLLDLAWSLWTELGVVGTKRKHRQVAVMPEELLLLTSALAPIDPRLRDESIAWCCRYHDCISTARLRSLFAMARKELRAALARYAATVNDLVGTRWPTPGDVHPWRVRPGGKSSLAELTRPALLNLRLRAIFGTGARADVIAVFLGSDKPNLAVAEVAQIGYTKRNIANVLDDLAAGGLLSASKMQNQLRYRWSRREALEALVAPLPRQVPNWRPIVDLVLMLYAFVERTEPMPNVVRGVEAANLLPSINRELALLQCQFPLLAQDPEKNWDQVARWAVRIVRSVASGHMNLS